MTDDDFAAILDAAPTPTWDSDFEEQLSGMHPDDREFAMEHARLENKVLPLLNGEKLKDESRQYKRNAPKDIWNVYRIDFSDGAAYVGITSRQIAIRVAEHFGFDGIGRATGEWTPSGDRTETYGIAERWRQGITARATCVASGLTKGEARSVEKAQIAKISNPINVQKARRRTVVTPGPHPETRRPVPPSGKKKWTEVSIDVRGILEDEIAKLKDAGESIEPEVCDMLADWESEKGNGD